MDFFDIALLLISFELIFHRFISEKVFLYSLYLGVITVLAQFFAVGYKWQYMPLYLIIIIFSIKYTFQFSLSNTILKFFSMIFLIFLFVLSGILIYFLPVPEFSNENGDYSVGIQQIVVDLNKANQKAFVEISTLEPNSKRSLPVDIYYPSNESTKPVQLVRNSQSNWGQSVVKYLNRAWEIAIPEFILNHLQLSSFNVGVEIEPINNTLPVLVYSHGWAGEKIFAADQLMNLAANGYYVVAIDHTGLAMFSDLPSGTVFNTGSSEQSSDVVGVMAAMATDIVDTLDYLKNNEFFADFNNISVMGHSTGAGAIHLYCLEHSCKTIIFQDPFLTPIFEKYGSFEVLNNSYFIYSEDWYSGYLDSDELTEIEVFTSINSNNNYVGYYLSDSKHYDFVAFGSVSPLTSYTFLKGAIKYGDSVTTNNYFNLQAIKNKPIQETSFLHKINK
jgi:pimeloyl-ACP methyl ester carboxylesterase